MKLSFRIFLWFSLVMAAVAAVLLVSSPWLTRTRPRLERWQQASETALAGRAAELGAAIERRGPDVIESLRRNGIREPRLQVFVLDRNGRELGGLTIPDEARELGERALASGAEEVERRATLHLAAQPATAPDGRHLVVVVGLSRPPGFLDLLEPRVLAPRVAVLMLLLGLLAFGLAGHLVRPVTAVRQAARRLANGDLAARVGRPVAGRHDEMGQLARDFDAMAERFQALVNAQRRLLGDVSHELRSPLARLRVAAELLREGAAGSTNDAIERIEREVVRVDDLVAQLLTLSRLEAGVEVEHAPVDLKALLEVVGADAALEARSRDCEVLVDAPVAVVVEGSTRLLRSAVDNVVRNAIHYTAPGTTVDLALTVEGNDEDQRALIRVSDRGAGVPESALERLFDPFFRVEDARERGAGGTGLGLAIAARSVHLHGGSIAARNGPSGGFVVDIVLPVSGSAGTS
jgi:two-component system sensor histidine kinase CpxA